MDTVQHTSPRYLAQSQLRARGWSPSLIEQLLGAPDRTAQNPYRSKQTMRLWAEVRVLAAEDRPEFRAYQDKRAKRSQVALAAADVRRQATLASLDGLQIDIPVLPLRKLFRDAVEHTNDLNLARHRDSWASLDAAREHLERWAVNYLRHQQSPYEWELMKVYRRVGVREARQEIRSRVLQAIANAYPELADECARQAARAAAKERARQAEADDPE